MRLDEEDIKIGSRLTSFRLHDFIHEDMARIYVDQVKFAKITLYDVAPNILTQFDDQLAKYAADVFNRGGIDIRTSRKIKELSPGLPDSDAEHQASRLGLTLKVKDEPDLGIGMCIWSTGFV